MAQKLNSFISCIKQVDQEIMIKGKKIEMIAAPYSLNVVRIKIQ